MLQVYVSNVLTVSNVCCKCFYGYCICCSGYTCMSQVYVLNVLPVSNLCCKCFIWMLHMFQTNVASVYSNVSSVSDICCKCFYLDVVVAIHICCKRMFVNVSSVSYVCYKSASCCNISESSIQM
jgi:hypothetical protein